MGRNFGQLFHAWSHGERRAARLALAIVLLAGIARVSIAVEDHSIFIPVQGGSYAEGVIGQPTAVNPLISSNPVDQDIAALVFSPLQTLTEAIEAEDDARTYRVTLKENLTWDDGEALTTDDIVFSIRLIQDPASASPLARTWEGAVVRRLSALQLIITLPDPYVFFGDRIASLTVLPRHVYAAAAPENLSRSSYALRPVGNGPYRVTGFSAARDGFITEYRLAANERYAGTPPFIGEFSFRFYATEAELADAMRLREVQGTGSLAPLSESIRSIPGVVVSELPMPRYYAVFLNQVNNPALANRSLREALSIGIDRAALVAGPWGGAGEPVASPVLHTAISGVTSTVPAPSFNPDRARSLLAAPSVTVPKLTLVVPRVPFLEAAAQSLSDAWADIGITVAVEPIDAGEFTDRILATRNFELALFGNILQEPQDLFPFWHSHERFAPGVNLSLYQNKGVDAAIERIRTTALSETERSTELVHVANLIAADLPAIFLVSSPYLYAHTERLAGFSAPQVVVPADRFAAVTTWSVARARILE